MNFKFKYLFLCLLWFGTSAIAQNKKAENTLFWEISGKDLKKPSYLFGTYHFADKGFVDTMKVINDKLKSADAVVGELIMDKSLPTKMLPYLMMKDTTLDKLFTPQEYTLVADYLKKLANLDLKMLNTMKPVVVQTLIMQFTSPKTFTATNPALDQYFQDYGRENGKNVLGLETLEDQVDALFSSSLARQKELLIKSIKEAEKNKSITDNLYKYYITQDLDQLTKLMTDTGDFTQEEMDKLLKNRNEKWLISLPQMMKDHSLFIAVGAGHLVGKSGLIKGLQAKGYTVKPVATKN